MKELTGKLAEVAAARRRIAAAQDHNRLAHAALAERKLRASFTRPPLPSSRPTACPPPLYPTVFR